MHLIFKVLIALLSIPFLGWGLMILFSDSYFAKWQNSVWKEKGGEQWSKENVKYNRYGRGLGSIIIGLGLLRIVFFAD